MRYLLLSLDSRFLNPRVASVLDITQTLHFDRVVKQAVLTAIDPNQYHLSFGLWWACTHTDTHILINKEVI